MLVWEVLLSPCEFGCELSLHSDFDRGKPSCRPPVSAFYPAPIYPSRTRNWSGLCLVWFGYALRRATEENLRYAPNLSITF